METPSGGTFAARVIGAVDELLRGAGGRLAAISPRLQRVLKLGREAYVRAFLRSVALRNRLQYRAPPHPDRLIRVAPDRIETVAEFPVAKFRLNGIVRCGEWDLDATPFEELAIYRAFRRHFYDGVPWTETAFFERVVEAIDDGAEPWGCGSRAAFEARCRRLDALYESMRSGGYRTQAALLAAGDRSNPFAGTADTTGKRRRDEIAVHIGRRGALIFEDGRNRLSMAKLLGIEAVPVRVLLRHCEWQATREAYVRGDIDESSDLVNHPDLRALDADEARAEPSPDG